MPNCPHYDGGATTLRRPLPGERFKTTYNKTCVCECGVCLGFIMSSGAIGYNPTLNEEQRHRVAVFLVGEYSAYQRRYYETVTKPKRRAERLARLAVESPRADPEDLQRSSG